MKRPLKDPLAYIKIRYKAQISEYIIVEHAKERMDQREVTDREVRYALMHGYREEKKDQYKIEHRQWNYAVKGKTFDDRWLRIIVSFDVDDMLIITVIDLGE